MKGFAFKQRANKTRACIVVQRMAQQSSRSFKSSLFIFRKLMVTKSIKSVYSTCLLQNIPPEKSKILDIYSVVTL